MTEVITSEYLSGKGTYLVYCREFCFITWNMVLV
jgi:hypothetical protein